MARLLTCGYETGDVAEAGASTIGASATITAVTSTPTPRGGTYCLKIATSSASFNITHKSFVLPVAKTEVWVRCAVFVHPISTANQYPLLQVRDAGGGVLNTIWWDPLANTLRLRLGSADTGTILGTSSTTLPADTWALLETRTQITSTTSGTSEVWLNGTQVITFTGDNVATSTANVQFVVLGVGTLFSSGAGAYLAYDDIAINDTAGARNAGRPGEGRIVLLQPSAAGSSTQLTRGGTDTGANYSQVNETPPSMTQYVLSATAGDRDLYTLPDLSIAIDAIHVVEAIVLAQNSDAGAGSIAPTIKSGSTTNEATAVALGTSAAYVTSRWETDPNTSAAWTASALNALEAGITAR